MEIKENKNNDCNDNVWAVAVVIETADGKINTLVESCIADSCENAIGYVLVNLPDCALNKGEKIIDFNANFQTEYDLFEMMKRKGWRKNGSLR